MQRTPLESSCLDVSILHVFFIFSQELYELAQRKFLRQVAHYAAKQEALYPRLFVADFAPDDSGIETLYTHLI